MHAELTPMFNVQRRLVLVDAMALLYRGHFGFKDVRLSSSLGEDTSILYGFVGTLLNLLQLSPPPTHLAVVFDAAGKTFRWGHPGAALGEILELGAAGLPADCPQVLCSIRQASLRAEPPPADLTATEPGGPTAAAAHCICCTAGCDASDICVMSSGVPARCSFEEGTTTTTAGFSPWEGPSLTPEGKDAFPRPVRRPRRVSLDAATFRSVNVLSVPVQATSSWTDREAHSQCWPCQFHTSTHS